MLRVAWLTIELVVYCSLFLVTCVLVAVAALAPPVAAAVWITRYARRERAGG